MMRVVLGLLGLFVVTERPALAATWRVPQDHQTIQAAIDAAQPGDTIRVAAGIYRERLKLKPGLILISDGDSTRGTTGLKRAEATTIDGGGKLGQGPGIAMAEGATLDGFTITNVGVYDDVLWKKHHDSQGEELGDEEGSVQAEGTSPAISIRGVSCVVTRCIVHHNGDVGIGILGHESSPTVALVADNIVYRNMGGGIGVAEGAEPIIRGNICRENLRAGIGCRKANPLITNNTCTRNVRAGIGCREGAQPVIRGNTCSQNRRAGIGIRMTGTAPVVVANTCNENDMAGIGCRDGAEPLIIENECRQNQMAGIGVELKANATIRKNICRDNKLVAIGVTNQATATIEGNELARSGGGQPPIIALRENSTATIRGNRINGGGVAAIVIQGNATIRENAFTGIGDKQGNAIWLWEGSIATIADNDFDGYRSAVVSNKASIVVSGNHIQRFQGIAITIRESPRPAHVFGNSASSSDPRAKVLDMQGPSGIVADNTLQTEAKP